MDLNEISHRIQISAHPFVLMAEFLSLSEKGI